MFEHDPHKKNDSKKLCNYENNQQDALYRSIYYSKSALHVSAMFSPIIRSTGLYLQYLVVFTQAAAGWQPATSRQQLG
jgi:hypothetical protein